MFIKFGHKSLPLAFVYEPWVYHWAQVLFKREPAHGSHPFEPPIISLNCRPKEEGLFYFTFQNWLVTEVTAHDNLLLLAPQGMATGLDAARIWC